MIKHNKWKLLLSLVGILLPAVFGAIVWEKLPDQMARHWGVTGNADALGSRLFAVLGLPLILLAVFWVAVLVIAWDHKKKMQDTKVYGVFFFSIPLVSLWVNGILYATAFGLSFNPLRYGGVLFGVIFLAIGNYLPKCRPNRTMGIRTKHTLSNEENWRASHRFCGRLWVLIGILSLLSIFLPEAVIPYVMGAVLALALLPPLLYPWLYARKQIREGRATKEDFKNPVGKPPKAVAIGIPVVILALVAVLMLTGGIEIAYGETSFTVDPTYGGAMEIDYGEVERIEYREELDRGSRVAGFGSVRLSFGSFRNEEFGSYSLYAYTGCDASVILYMKDGSVIVLGAEDVAGTEEVYQILDGKIK